MGFSERDSDVRVDFFKTSGKWYTTVAINMEKEYNNKNIHEALLKSIIVSDAFRLLEEMDAICIEPYSIVAHPIKLKAGSTLKSVQWKKITE